MTVWMGEAEGLDGSVAAGLATTLASKAEALGAAATRIGVEHESVRSPYGSAFAGPHAEDFTAFVTAERPVAGRIADALGQGAALVREAGTVVEEYERERERIRQEIIDDPAHDVPLIGILTANIEGNRRGDELVARLRGDARMSRISGALQSLGDGIGVPLERGAAHDRAVALLGAPVVLAPGQSPADLLGGGDGPLLVTGTTDDGYEIGRAYVVRRNGVVYLVEVDGDQSVADAIREIEEDIEPDLRTLEEDSTIVTTDGSIDEIWVLQDIRPGDPDVVADAGGGRIRVFRSEADGADSESLDYWTITHEYAHVYDDGQASGLGYRFALAADAVYRRREVPEFGDLVTVSPGDPRWDNLSVTGIGVTQYGDDPDDAPGYQGAPAGNNTEDFADALALWTLQKQQGYVAIDPGTGQRYTFAELFPARAVYFARTFG